MLLSFTTASRGLAQASPYLPTDDPRMPLIEHLIARGDVRDPSPLERPFRKSDILAALSGSSNPVAIRLAASLAPDRGASWIALSGRAGPQAFTQGRKDLLHPGGKGSPGGYAELQVESVRGPIMLAGRLSLDTRLSHDPDYPESPFLLGDRSNLRVVDTYVGLQGRWGWIQLGQVARNWGPVGMPGIPLSDAAYPRPDIGVRLGRGLIRFSSIATNMKGSTNSSGEEIKRYFVAHRVTVSVGRGLTIAGWEVGIIAGTANELDGSTRAVVPLLVIPAVWASRSHRNEMVGGDFSWKLSPRLRLEGQLAIDDWNFDSNNPYPQRWAGSVSSAGPLGGTSSWRLSYTTASSLAFRTLNPEENIVDQGIGIGRLFPDNEIVDLTVGIPVAETWLVAPRMALLRQGEGRIQTPFPSPTEAASTPSRFIGVTANSFWAGLAVSGGYQRLQVTGEGGLRHTSNAGHVAGRISTTLEGRVTATLGFALRKVTQ